MCLAVAGESRHLDNLDRTARDTGHGAARLLALELVIAGKDAVRVHIAVCAVERGLCGIVHVQGLPSGVVDRNHKRARRDCGGQVAQLSRAGRGDGMVGARLPAPWKTLNVGVGHGRSRRGHANAAELRRALDGRVGPVHVVAVEVHGGVRVGPPDAALDALAVRAVDAPAIVVGCAAFQHVHALEVVFVGVAFEQHGPARVRDLHVREVPALARALKIERDAAGFGQHHTPHGAGVGRIDLDQAAVGRAALPCDGQALDGHGTGTRLAAAPFRCLEVGERGRVRTRVQDGCVRRAVTADADRFCQGQGGGVALARNFVDTVREVQGGEAAAGNAAGLREAESAAEGAGGVAHAGEVGGVGAALTPARVGYVDFVQRHGLRGKRGCGKSHKNQ